MADKWVPKPCNCFQRKGFGTIFIVGNTIHVFDEEFNLTHVHEKTTYYEALQEVLLSVGALNLKSLAALESAQGEEDE